MYYNPNERKKYKAVLRNREIRDNPTYTQEEWEALRYVLGWCARCGSMADLTKDHKVPIGRGGTNSLENLTLLCGSCNRLKAARMHPDPVPTYLLPSQEKRMNELSPLLKDRIRRAIFGPSSYC